MVAARMRIWGQKNCYENLMDVVARKLLFSVSKTKIDVVVPSFFSEGFMYSLRHHSHHAILTTISSSVGDRRNATIEYTEHTKTMHSLNNII
jgi:hypothetical protein